MKPQTLIERGGELMDEKECCGTCKWHRHEGIDDGWVCVNADSEYCTLWTEYGDSCIDWEGKRNADVGNVPPQ